MALDPNEIDWSNVPGVSVDPSGGVALPASAYQPSVTWGDPFGLFKFTTQGPINPAYGPTAALVNQGVVKPEQKAMAKKAKEASAKKAGEDDYNAGTANQIAEFVKMLKDPNYLNSAYAQRIGTSAGNAASNAARARGIEGPLAVNGVQGSVANALGGLDLQRQQMLQSALGLKSQHGLNAAEADYQRQLNDYAMKYDMARQQQSNQSGLLGALGGLAGGAIGNMIAPGVGFGVGSKIGSGLGGMVGGGFRPPTMPQYGGYRPRGGY